MKNFLKENGIEQCSLIPLERCKVIKEYLLTKNGLGKDSSVLMMLIPYRHEKSPVNLSVYASVKDYHLFVNSLAEKIEAFVKNRFPDSVFKMFADHSPIDEVHAACISGLGFIGDNGLLINKKYSSFVFLAECITNLTPDDLGIDYAEDVGVTECMHCKKCADACPAGCIKKTSDSALPKSQCLSAITQKKGELTKEEIKMMLDSGCIWGCDICQNACPYTKNAEYTPIEFFKTDVITELNSQMLNSFSDEEFNARPFSWRGKGVIGRNVALYEEVK